MRKELTGREWFWVFRVDWAMPAFPIRVAHEFRFRKSICSHVHLTLLLAVFRWLCCWDEKIIGICACLLWPGSASFSAPKPHSVSFGKWASIRLIEEGEEKQIDLRVRPPFGGRTKEFTVGQPQDVTEQRFVVQRVYRWNGSPPPRPVRFSGLGNAADGSWLAGAAVECRRCCCRRLIPILRT
jgi:hypothetical protein